MRSRSGLVRRVGVLGAALLVSIACSSQEATTVGSSQEPTIVGLPFFPPAHDGEPFAEEMFAEQAQVPQITDAAGNVVGADFAGTYTNVEEQVRRTASVGSGGPTIWFFGGSTMFGTGQRDQHTIPSEIVRLAADAGTPLEAVNFGFPAYLARHQVAVMRQALAERPTPDLIVYFHGHNDLGASCRLLALGESPGAEGNPLLTTPPSEPVVDCRADPESTGEIVAGAIDESMAVARAATSVPILEFWQPAAATRSRGPADAALLDHLATTEDDLRAQAAPYRVAIGATDRTVVDLTDAMNAVDDPIYFDWAHTNELGARLVAEAMWERGLASAVERISS